MKHIVYEGTFDLHDKHLHVIMQTKIIVVLILNIISIFFPGYAVKNLPLTRIGTNLFHISTSKTTWAAAAKFCRSRGLSLLDSLSSMPLLDEETSVWLGIKYDGEEFYSIQSGFKVTFTSETEDESCLISTMKLGPPKFGVKSAKNMKKVISNDAVSCNGSFRYICNVPAHCLSLACFMNMTNVKHILKRRPTSVISGFGTIFKMEKAKSMGCEKSFCTFPCKKGEFWHRTNLRQFKSSNKTQAIWLNACNQQYFINVIELVPSESFRSCCNFGMKLATFPTQQKLDCFVDAFKGSKVHLAFWTAAYDTACEGLAKNFEWCYREGNFNISTPWTAGQPDRVFDVESCVALLLSPRTKGLFAQSCQLSLPFICESTEIDPISLPSPETLNNLTNSHFVAKRYTKGITPPSDTYNYVCLQRRCRLTERGINNSDLNYFKKNGTFYIDPQAGTIFKACGNKTFLITKKEASAVTDIFSICCELGMNVASVATQEKVNCIHEAYKDSEALMKIVYTSGVDQFFDGRFVDCNTMDFISPDAFSPGSPNFPTGGSVPKFCLSLNLNSAHLSSLTNQPCNSLPLPVLCEVPESPRNESLLAEKARLMQQKDLR